MIVTLIVALDEDRVIGRDGALPWRLSADLRRFKALTTGHHLIMGRKTYESIGRPLPGRTSIVLTRQPDWSAPGARSAETFDAALAIAAAAGEREVFVIGGAEVFRAAWSRADRLQLTRVAARVAGDVRLDAWDESDWRLATRESHAADDKNEYAYAFETYERRPGRGTASRESGLAGG